MKTRQISQFFFDLRQWFIGGKELWEVSMLIEGNIKGLPDLLFQNGLVNFDNRPIDGYPFEEFVHVILLYLALKHKHLKPPQGR